MHSDIETLLGRLLSGDDEAVAQILRQAETSQTPAILVAAALISDHNEELLARATRHARTTRDRQLVAVATAYLNDDTDRLDALVRDHLCDYPDNILASWIAAKPARLSPLASPHACTR